VTASDAAFEALHSAGWSVGDAAFWTADGLIWLVSGSNGENMIRAAGTTCDEAWANAVEQARGVGMLRTIQPKFGDVHDRGVQ
jgi:hypothetical protein